MSESIGPYCPHCSSKLPTNYVRYEGMSAFCSNCGKRYTVTKEMMMRPTDEIEETHSKRQFSSVKIVGLILITLLIGMGIGYGMAPISESGQQTITLTESAKVDISTVTRTVTKTVTTQPSIATPKAEGEWTTIYTFKGIDDKTSEDFNVPVNYWRFKYTVQAEHEKYAHFSVYIYLSNEKTYEERVSFHRSGSDISYVRAGPGNFYIDVNAANLRSWTIEAQIQK